MSTRSFRDRYGSLGGAAENRSRQPAVPPEWPLPQGARLRETDAGLCVVHDRVYTGDEVAAARERLERAAGGPGGRIPPAELLFVDTESTGLAGGTGTHAFLVGVGRFTGSAFVVRQLFMRHPGDERAVLRLLADELGEAAGVVTYNGRAFDMPLLETRYRIHGQPLPAPATHLDLLATSRAIWKHRLASCSLASIERAILGVQRELDAPGWLIPQLYFDWLRTRRIEPLEPVFEHNRYDILSLARIAALVHGWESGIDAPDDAVDRLALALLRLRREPSDALLDQLRHLWREPGIPSELRLRALRDLTVALKRRRHWEAACELWNEASRDASRAVRLLAVEELAKYLEHQQRDHERALALARRGADGAALAQDDPARDAFARRVRRLERKLQQGGARRPDTDPGR